MFIRNIIVSFYILFNCFSLYADQLPDIGDIDRTNLSYIDAEKIGFQIMLNIKNSHKIILDYELNDYVQNLGLSLIGFSYVNKFHFFVLSGNEINAFALPGGFICIYNGLIANTQSEAELVGVIAHEIGHIVQHHVFRNISIYNRSQYISVASLIAAALLSMVNPALAIVSVNSGQSIAIQNILSFSRDFEREADRIGQSIMYASGYDPNAMPSFFQKLEEQNKFDSQLKNNFLQTHPVTIERLSEAQLRANQYKVTMRADSFMYQLMKERSRVWQIGGYKAIKYYNDKLLTKRYADINNIYYGLAFAYYLINDTQNGLLYLDKIKFNSKVNLATIYSLKGLLLRQAYLFKKAEDLYRNALLKYPNYKALYLGNADNYIEQKKFKIAQKLLIDLAKIHPDDNDIWSRLVDINSDRKLNNPVNYYYALGNISYYNYNFVEAQKQYSFALDLLIQNKSKDDNRIANIISAKLEEIKQINIK
jgi:predicted Zn-dependent protease